MPRNDAFVGRADQLRALIEHWQGAVAGRGAFVLVSGEGGIGKTRLVEELVDRVGGEGRVVWGTCPAPDGPPLWPWREVLGDAALPAPAAPPAVDGLADPAGAAVRHRAELVDAVHRAARGPLLVVLDDLHRADAESAALLRLVAADARRLPLLLVATLRSTDLLGGSAVHEALTDLAATTELIELVGLGAEPVAQLVGALTGGAARPPLAEAVLARTGGNPFFVREVLRLLVTEGRLDGVLAGGDLPVPPLVRDVVLRRVAQLPSRTRAVLDAAAIVGRESDCAVVGAVAGMDRDEVADAARPAEAARLIDLAPGRLRFAHDLVRDALADDLDAAVRRRLHHAAAGALATVSPSVPVAAEIATHLCAALPLGKAETAASACLDAARHSLGLRAPSDAAAHAERGLTALGTERSPLRGQLLLVLGDARTSTGERKAARRAYAEAAGVARDQSDTEALATAALGFAGLMGTPRPDMDRIALLEEAAAAMEGRRDALAARLQSRLAHALLFSGDPERRLRLADDALSLARETGDRSALINALYVWNILNASSSEFPRRLAAAEELVQLGRSSGDDEVEAWALHVHAHHMLEAGDFSAFDADVAAGDVLAQRTHSATWQWSSLLHRAMRATMQGRFDDAEALGNEAFELGLRSQHELAGAAFFSHLSALRTWQGRLGELVETIVAAAGRYTEIPGVQASVPYALAEIGQLPEASDALRRLVAERGLADVHRGQSWTAAMAMLARAAFLCGDAEVAAKVRPMLLTFADRHVIGPLADSYFGPTSLYIGLCSATVGDLTAAAAELAHAVDHAEAGGARPVAAWARAELAAVLEQRGDDADAVAAVRALAVAELEALGMGRHLERLGPSAVSAPTVNVFRADGDSWAATFAGRTVRLRSTKGLHDIHRLLAAPGVELHVLELARDGADGHITSRSRQPVLDEHAKQAYRRRLLALEAEVDDARACADLVRAERAELERDAVVGELTAALGLGGRDRNMADEAERARQAVRARIRYALDRLGRVHPELRRHLDHALVTGTFCSYRPERPTAWDTG